MMRAIPAIVCSAVLMSSCMDQYDPVPYWKQFTAERQMTSSNQLKLTEKGEMPAPVSAAADADPILAKYTSLCGSRHGADGKADGAAALAMNPKPRNFHDKAWQAKVDDAHITKVIKEGGTAVGLSGTMPPWGAVLSDDDIKALVAKIREWGK